MIFNNPFQKMLLLDLREHKAISVTEEVLCFYFPMEPHSEMWYSFRLALISAGMPPTDAGDPWDEPACKIFCSRNNVLMDNRNSGEVLFVLRSS
jgi:hypothetical protein